MADVKMESLVLEIKAIQKGAKNLDSLKQALMGLRSGVDSITSVSDQAISKLHSLAEAMSKLGTAAKDLKGVGKALKDVASASPKPDLSKAKDDTIAVPESTNEKLYNPFTDLKKAMAEAMPSIVGGAKELTSKVSSIFQGIGKAINSAWSGVKTGFGNMAKLGSKALEPLRKRAQKFLTTFSKIGAAIGRVAAYRILRSAIKAVGQAFKEGTNNCYMWAKAVGNALAPAMDNISADMLYLKNSIGAMVSPLIQALAPAIRAVTDEVVTLLNAINQLIARLSGAGSWTKAIRGQKEYNKAIGGGSKAVKDYLLGIDELNVLNDNGGSGGGASSEDYGGMFEQVGEFADWVNDIGALIDKGQFEEAGALLATYMNEMIDGLPTETWGTTLGNKLANAIDFGFGFMSQFNWDNVGAKLADFFNGVLESKIDWQRLGTLLVAKWQALFGVLDGFASTLNFDSLGKAIGDTLTGMANGIDLGKAAQALSKGVSGLLQTVAVAAKTFDWKGFAQNVVNGIRNIDWISMLRNLGSAANNLTVGLLDWINTTLEGINWEETMADLKEGFREALEEIDWSEVIGKAAVAALNIGEAILELIGGAVSGILDLIGDIFGDLGLPSVEGFFQGLSDAVTDGIHKINELFIEPIINKVKELFGIHSPSTVFEGFGADLVAGLFNGLSENWQSITTFFSDSFEGIKSFVGEKWEDIKTNTSETWGVISEGLGTTWNNLKEGASEKFKNIWDKISGTWKSTDEDTTQKWSNIGKTTSETWTDMRDKVKEKWDEMSKKISDKWDDTKTATTDKWRDIVGVLEEKFKIIGTKVTEITDSIYKKFHDKFEDAKTFIHDTLEKIKGFFNFTWQLPPLKLPHMHWTYDAVDGAMGQLLSKLGLPISLPKLNIEWYADGGMVRNGQIFGMNENEPELIGQIGHQSTVINQSQIIEGVAQGVANAMASVLSQLDLGSDRPIVVNIDGREVFNTQESVRRDRGFNMGMGAFTYGS